MLRSLRGYPVTLLAVALLALSFVVLVLSSSGALPADGIWRRLVIPAYLGLLVIAVLRTALPGAGGLADVVFILAGMTLLLLPFVAIDWLVGRRRRLHSAPAA